MRPEDDEDDAPATTRHGARSLAQLHGMWFDQVRGSVMCIDARGPEPRTIYASGQDHTLTGVYERWRCDGSQFVGEFRWLDGRFSGYVVLQVESDGVLVGGWWYGRDVPREQVGRLPFLPGVNPCRWIRQPAEYRWPEWAWRALGFTRPITTADLRLLAGAERRYHERVALWTGSRGGLARLGARAAHHGWWLLHNLVAHPLLALSRGRAAVAFHDWTSARLGGRADVRRGSPLPQVERPLWWLLHNLGAHVAIGLAPCAATFRWHDATARRMRVRGWV